MSVLVQFALMERQFGAAERAEALFEQVLAVYPHRVDVCAVYADMLVKAGELDRLRCVTELLFSIILFMVLSAERTSRPRDGKRHAYS